MFDKTQYAIEEKVLPRIKLRESYDIKDVNGNLLDYAKMRSVGPVVRGGFWFEGTDGTRLGEVREVARRKILFDRYDVYDDQNQLRYTIKRGESRPGEEKWFPLVLILSLLPAPVGFIALLVTDWFPTLIIGFAFTAFGLIYLGYKFGRKRNWYRLIDSEGKQLAKADMDFHRWLAQVLAPDGHVIA